MIPSMIVFGILCGRRWIAAIVGGGLLWGLGTGAVSVYANDGTFGWGLVLGAVLLGATYSAFGAGMHQMVLWATRKIRATKKASIH